MGFMRNESWGDFSVILDMYYALALFSVESLEYFHLEATSASHGS
jgi:hypothetical protein